MPCPLTTRSADLDGFAHPMYNPLNLERRTSRNRGAAREESRMRQRMPWLNRDDPSYDPNRIGAITEAKVLTALIEAGKIVWMPYLQVARSDLAIEEHGRFYRIQCKTGRLFRGAV